MSRRVLDLNQDQSEEYSRPPPRSRNLYNPSNGRTTEQKRPNQKGEFKAFTIIARKLLKGSSGVEGLKEVYTLICGIEKELESSQEPQFEKRLELFKLYSVIIEADFKLSQKNDLDSRQWKHSVYLVFSRHRNQFSKMTNREMKGWKDFLDNIVSGLSDLVEILKGQHEKPVWAKRLAHIGDIYRYQAQFFSSNIELKISVLDVAKKYYLTARNLVPSNGAFFNQLALVARMQNLHIEAVSYHLRALCLKKSLETARDSLLEVLQRSARLENSDSSMILVNVLSPELFLFEMTFLKMIATLYTKAGLERWAEKIATMAYEIPSLDFLTPIQQMDWWYTISECLIGTLDSVGTSVHFDDSAKKVLLEAGVDLLLAVFGQISVTAANNQAQLMFIGIALSWMSTANVSCAFDGKHSKFWKCAVSLYHDLIPEGFEEPEEIEVAQVYERSSNIPEDDLNADFEPLTRFVPCRNSIIEGSAWFLEDMTENEIVDMKRSARVILLFVFLSKVVMCYNYQKHVIVNLNEVDDLLPYEPVPRNVFSFEELSGDGANGVEFEEEEDRRIMMSVDELVGDTEPSPTSILLKTRIQSLNLSIPRHTLVAGETVLVFDTNIFLRGVVDVARVVESKRYMLVVPLPVFMELEGIGKSGGPMGVNAIEALNYVKKNLETIKVQSSRGNYLQNLAISNEIWDPRFSNADDVILEICRYHKQVCLLTNDANLRLKARAVNLFVLDSIKKIF